ncbi:MAG: type IX secretion system protein PorQ [Flavobacteriales bacterium]
MLPFTIGTGSLRSGIVLFRSPIVLRLFPLLLVLLLAMPGKGQSPGGRSFQFLDLVGSARVAALGGQYTALHDDDITLAVQQPAILDSSVHQHLALNYVDHFAGIGYGFASYAHDFGGQAGTWAGTIQYVNYGTFDRRNLLGFKEGTFTAASYAINISHGRWLDSNFAIGGNLKLVHSQMLDRWAMGVGLDLSGMYVNTASGFTASLSARNIGGQVKSYYANDRAPLPFEIRGGITKTLEHAPFRLGVMLRDLQQWKLRNPESGIEKKKGLFGSKKEDSVGTRGKIGAFFDNTLRHLIFNVEVLITENIHIRIGYDYRRRAELQIEEKPGFVGFNWGIGFKIDRFRFSYGRSSYHLSGGKNHFTVTTDLGAFRSKK